MDELEQMKAFSDDLDRLVCRYEKEFDISLGSIIASLEMKKHLLMCEAVRRRDELNDGY